MTLEEIVQRVSEAPELRDGLLAHLKQENKLVIRSAEEEQQFLSNFEKTRVQQALRSTDEFGAAVGERLKEVHEKYEADIKTLFGADKQPNERSFEYLNRVASEFKKTHESTDEKVKWYETKVKDVESKLTEKEQQLADFQKQLVHKEFDFEFSKALASVKLKGVDDEYRPQEESFMRESFLRRHEVRQQDGKLVVYKDGQPVMGSQTYEPVPVSELIRQEFGYKFDTGSPGPTGSGNPSPPAATVRKPVVSQQEAFAKARAEGLPLGGRAFIQRVAELTEA
jgi:hypothetical protein